MKKLKQILLLAALCWGSQAAIAQSAIMDLSADDKGILIPRLDFNNAPATPDNGLLIYVTSNGPEGDDRFYYFNGTGWIALGPSPFAVPGQEAGDLLYFDGTNWVRLPKGNEGETLKIEDGVPKWAKKNMTNFYLEEF